MIVNQRRQQVVGDADGVEITGEMEVDILHRNHLRVAAAGGAALHAEAGAQRRLAQADQGVLADGVKTIAQANRGGGFAFASRRGRDGGHQDQLAIFPVLQTIDVVEGKLSFIRAVLEDLIRRNVHFRGDFGDWLHGRLAGDFDVTLGHEPSIPFQQAVAFRRSPIRGPKFGRFKDTMEQPSRWRPPL